MQAHANKPIANGQVQHYVALPHVQSTVRNARQWHGQDLIEISKPVVNRLVPIERCPIGERQSVAVKKQYNNKFTAHETKAASNVEKGHYSE